MAFIETWFYERAASPSHIYHFLDFSSLFIVFEVFFLLYWYFLYGTHIFLLGFWTCCLFICKGCYHSNFAPARGPSLRGIWNSSLHMLRSSC